MSDAEKIGVENDAENGVVIEVIPGTEVVTAGKGDILLRRLTLRSNLVKLITISRCGDDDKPTNLYDIRDMGNGYFNIVFNDSEISEHHCVIYKSDGKYYLYDGIWYLKNGKFSRSNISADGEQLEPFQTHPSTNGTYHTRGAFRDIRRLDNGEKKELKTGDKITACRYAFEIEIR